MNKELIDRFEKETNNEFYTTNIDNGEDLYSYDFVDWLIKQLPIHGVVGQSEQLKPKPQICYKSNELCKYDCFGLCKESC